MKHIFQQGENTSSPTLLLLHGTGGTEQDLLPVAEMIDPKTNLLSVRGNVSENGMPRFFRRLAEGVFDEEDLILRTKELHEFLDHASKEYSFERDNIVAVGYSNGANIAGSLLFHFRNALKGAVLLHPMVPRRNVDIPDLTGTQVFIGAGSNDPICPASETKDLTGLLENSGASVKVHWEHAGHQLTRDEIGEAANWYKEHYLD